MCVDKGSDDEGQRSPMYEPETALPLLALDTPVRAITGVLFVSTVKCRVV